MLEFSFPKFFVYTECNLEKKTIKQTNKQKNNRSNITGKKVI